MNSDHGCIFRKGNFEFIRYVVYVLVKLQESDIRRLYMILFFSFLFANSKTEG